MDNAESTAELGNVGTSGFLAALGSSSRRAVPRSLPLCPALQPSPASLRRIRRHTPPGGADQAGISP
jgi:hypothetical protein